MMSRGNLIYLVLFIPNDVLRIVVAVMLDIEMVSKYCNNNK